MERSFSIPFRLLPERPLFFPCLKDQLKDTPPFFSDTKIDVEQRTFYFNSGNFNAPRSEALAIGFALSYKSGWLLDRLSVGSVLRFLADVKIATRSGGRCFSAAPSRG